MTNKTLKLIAFGVVAATTIAAAFQGVVLRRELKANSSETYAVSWKMDQVIEAPNGLGEQDMKMVMDMTYTVNTKDVDATKGEANAETITKVDKLDITGSAAQLMGPDVAKVPPPVTAPAKLDARGRIILQPEKKADVRLAMMTSGMSVSSMGMLVELPEKAVSIGDTWEVPLPKSPFTGDKQTKLTMKLTGEKELNGKPVWVVAVTGKVEMDVDLSAVMKEMGGAGNTGMPDMKMLMKGSSDLKGEGMVDKATGKTLAMDTTMSSKMTLMMPDMGMNVPMNGDATIKLRLK